MQSSVIATSLQPRHMKGPELGCSPPDHLSGTTAKFSLWRRDLWKGIGSICRMSQGKNYCENWMLWKMDGSLSTLV